VALYVLGRSKSEQFGGAFVGRLHVSGLVAELESNTPLDFDSHTRGGIFAACGPCWSCVANFFSL
jgi:hypothetical protein